MEFAPHYWKDKNVIGSTNESGSESGFSSKSRNGSGSEESLPRQSVMRRPSFTKLESPPPPRLRRKSGSDYKPSSSSHASSSSSLSSSEDDSSSDEARSRTMDVEQPLVMSHPPKKNRRARFGSDSSDDDVSVDDASGNSDESSRHGQLHYTQNYQKPTKTRIGVQGSSPFTSRLGANTTHTQSVRSFYKQDDSYLPEETSYGVPRRKATMNVRYVTRKLSDYKDELSEEDEESGDDFRRHGRGRRDRDSDSEFQMSDEEEEEMESTGSSSLTEESSSDEYTPHPRKARGSTSRKGRQRRRKGSDSDDYGGWGRVRATVHESPSDSGSDYDPGGSYGRKKRRGRRAKKRRKADDWEEEEEEEEGYTRTTGRRREHVSYKESTDDDDEGEEEEGEENAVARNGQPAPQEDDNREKIEKILKHRRGKVGDTGKTCYAIGPVLPLVPSHLEGTAVEGMTEDGRKAEEEEGGRGGEESKTKTELEEEDQYLVKWVGWSHLHNTWETEVTLLKMNVKGMKRFENYIKRFQERMDWERHANPEDLEYFKCQEELSDQLLNQHTEVERIIDAHRSEEGSGEEYLCKWKGLPYSECTWEDSSLIADQFQKEIDMYHDRNESDRVPSRNSKVLRHRPKFSILKKQPSFLARDRPELELRDYQLDGVNWMVHAWCKCNSVILADEMGLGKTIQSISLLSCLFHLHGLYGPFLLVVPLSTLPAWQREFEMWAPEMNLVVYIGDVNSRSKIQQYEWTHSNGKVKFNAILTTYDILLKDKEFLGSLSWAVLLVDEAHRLKNDDSLLYRTLSSFHTNYRLLITGTPLQNSLKELWSLLHFIMKDRFPNCESFENQHRGYVEGDTEELASLHKQLEPFLLRRVKKDVEKSLPAKVEQILRVEMSSVQKQYYRWILTKNYKALSKGVKGSITGFINLVMELKKCCNHTYLVRTPDTPDVTDPLQSLLRGSGKLYLLDKLLVRLKETGHRVLIFSQMVRMLDLLAEYMQIRHFPYQRLDGSITGQARKEAIDQFNAEGSQDFCFLLSTRAGGLGVNLATADTVVIFDSDWNPQNDLQAQARAHRIGQTKQVNIYRLVTQNSVEEDIVERAKKKMVLDHLIIQRMDTTGRTVLSKSSGPSNNNPFNKEELNAILKFGTDELFKDDSDSDKALQEMDIDDILRRAETQEAAAEESSMANDLLSQFKVASFTIDKEEFTSDKDQHPEPGSQTPGRRISVSIPEKSWEEIIPQCYREQIDEEEKQRMQFQLFLPPRQRTVKNYYEPETPVTSVTPGTAVMEAPQRRKRKRQGGRGGTEAHDGSGGRKEKERTSTNTVLTKDLPGFTGSEIRRFARSYRRFPLPATRLDAIAADAGLLEKSLSDLESLAAVLHDGCSEAESHHQEQLSKNPEGCRQGHSILQLCGINIPALSILSREEELQCLATCIPTNPKARKRFRLVTRAKPVSWPGVKWSGIDDSRLLVGVYQHGLGNWENIRDDPELGLRNKIMHGNRQQKPQAQHLQTRVEYLLKLLWEETRKNGGKKAGGRATIKEHLASSKKKEPDRTTRRKGQNRKTHDSAKGSQKSRGGASHRPKREEKVQQQEMEGPEAVSSSESTVSSVDDDTDDDFMDEWKRGKKSRKRPATSTGQSQAKRSRNNNNSTGSGLKSSRVPSSRRQRKGGRKDKRDTKLGGKYTGQRGTKRRQKREDVTGSEGEGGVSWSHELDEKNFQKCKSLLKPVKRCLMQLAPTPPDQNSAKDVLDLFNQTIVEIGDHINSCLNQFGAEESKEWKSNLWIFVAKFTAVSARKLYSTYKTTKVMLDEI